MKIRNQILAVTIAATIAASAAQASSHREAPNISRMPAVDATDFYVFRSYGAGRGGFVTFIANYLPFQDPFAGPNYFPLDDRALYEIHIDQDGDAIEDLTYQFRFQHRLGGGDEGIAIDVGGESVPVPLKNIGPVSADDLSFLNFRETYTIRQVTGDRRTGVSASLTDADSGSTAFRKPYDFVGVRTFGGANAYAQYSHSHIYDVIIPDCAAAGRVFVGQRNDPFAANLGRIFDIVNFVPVDAARLEGGIRQDPARDVLAGKNVTTFALELPRACVAGDGNGVIGAWTTASVFGGGGAGFRQVSRLGNPLVNEVVIGLPDKDAFNASEPEDDAQFATYVTNPTLPALLDALVRDTLNELLGTNHANIAPSNLPREDLVAAFLTGIADINQQQTVTPSEILRLNTLTPITPLAQQSRFGVLGGDLAGFPNGRRPGDDVVDIALRIAMGRLCFNIVVDGEPIDLGLCEGGDAPVGRLPFTDGAPISAPEFFQGFPYLRPPLSGSGTAQ